MLVIDASVAVKFLVDEPGSDIAEELITDPKPLIAPDWIFAKVANALWRKWSRGEIADAHVIERLRQLPRFFAQIMPSAIYLEGAMRGAFALKPAIYDCLYLRRAIRENRLRVTADEKFVSSAREGGLDRHVRLLGGAPR